MIEKTEARQPAYDAVFAYIRSQPRDFLPRTVVGRNAMIWRAVHAALDAMDGQTGPAATEATEPIACSVKHCDPDQCGIHGNGCTWRTEPASSPLREQISAAMLRTLRRHGEVPTPDVIRLIDDFAGAVLAAILPATRITATLARMSEADVKRVIEVVESGPPSGTAIPGEWEHGWDAAMGAVRAALTPATDQPKEQ